MLTIYQQMSTKKSQKIPEIFYCEKCNYKTVSHKDFNKHLLTAKHKKIHFVNEKIPKNPKNDKIWCCECGKIYKERTGLWKHKKVCIKNDNEKNNINELKEIVTNLMKHNNELIKTITEITPKISNTIITNNTTNHFNLQFFLNEQCKDAISMNDFVKNLQITMNDLNYTKDNGLIKGITDVKIRGLKELDIYKRPIHCTDTKRETLYIKDEDKWEKDEHNEKIKETILTIANKERDAINEWKEEYPLWNEDEEIQNEFMLLVNKVYTPIEEQENYEKKIIRNISKEILVNK